MVVWKKYSSPQAIVYHICQWDGSWWLLYILAVGLSRIGGSPSRLPCSWKTWWSTIVRISNFQTNPWYFLLGWETSWIIQIRFLSMDFWEALFFFIIEVQDFWCWSSCTQLVSFTMAIHGILVVLEISLVTPWHQCQMCWSRFQLVMLISWWLAKQDILHAITAVWYWKHDQRLYICSRKSNRRHSNRLWFQLWFCQKWLIYILHRFFSILEYPWITQLFSAKKLDIFLAVSASICH